MAESMQGLHRSHRCTEVSNTNIGEKVTVMGWVQKRRNLGSLIFVDLRDRSGILQLVFDDENAYEFINQNKAECVDSLIAKIGERIGKEINVVIKKNETGRTAKETVPDLRDLIQFEIEEENF